MQRMCLALVLLCGAAQAQEINASLDRETIFLGESVLLKIDLVNPESDSRPDYLPLDAQFNRLDTGTNSSLELTNGQRRLKVQHNILLEPKIDGTLVLPPLKVGKLTTQPITLTVLERPKADRNSDQDVFVELEAVPLEPYVHSQVRLTVRLFHAPPITEGALNNEPWPDGLVVERVGDDRTNTQVIDGKRYRVVERRFALFPERSGTLQIPPVSFRGRVADPGGGNASLFSRGRRVSVSSDPLTLEVKPQPASFSGDLWLPAADLTLSEVWPNGEPSFVQGEPVTRKLELRARGLLSVQLPDIALPDVAGIKVYPDQPSSKTNSSPTGWALASRDQTYALVPTEAGVMTLPEIRIPWWDVEANQERVAVIPARQVDVAPGQSAALSPDLIPQFGASADRAEGGIAGTSASPTWWPALSAVLAVLWLGTAVAWWRAKNAVPRQAEPVPDDRQVARAASERQWRERLTKACEANDGRAAAQALISLARTASGQSVNSLHAAAMLATDGKAVERILELDQCLYSQGGNSWSGAALAQAVDKLKFRSATEEQVENVGPVALPPLYSAILVLSCGLALATAGGEATAQPAERGKPGCGVAPVLITGATIHTVVSGQPSPEALVYSPCGKVLAIGSAADLMRDYSKAQALALPNATVVPGLVDAHGHIMNLGLGLLAVNLRDTASKAEVLERLRDFSRNLPPEAWLLGRGWDQNDWPEKAFPTRADLDALFPDRPVWLTRIDGHAAWGNSAALAEADRDFSGGWQPEGGQIQRDSEGEATGIFVDRAMAFVQSQVPAWTEADRRRALKLAMASLAAAGITGVHDAGTSQQDLERFLVAEKADELTLRIYAMADGDQELLQSLCQDTVHTDRVSARSVKLYADGALGSRGAALIADYSDDPGNRGLLLQPKARLTEQVTRAMGCGLQVNTHAIGDLGNRVVLDAYESGSNEHPANPGRHRIEHAQVISPRDFPRFAELSLIASVQPTHATSDMYWAQDRVGPVRIRGAYAWRRMRELSIPLALGSDFPVEKINPMLGLHAAVTRQDVKGWPAGGWYADQVLTREEALHGFTLGAAYAAFAENEVGSLEVGKFADLVILDRDIMAIPADDIPSVNVLATVVGGRAVYLNPDWSSP
ncbi:MAG: amidohydrolase family protein, partial [Pseudomonadota bacterium]